MRYKAVIFDMDGTILNTLDDIVGSVNYSLREAGYPERTRKDIRKYLGKGVRELIANSLPQNTAESEIEKVIGIYAPYYKEHCNDATKPYDGIKGVISEIRKAGLKTAVISNKADNLVQELAVQHFAGLFDVVAGWRDDVRRKPYPDMVYEVLEKLSVDKKDVVFVGDSEIDAQTAANAGLNCISVPWGFRDLDELKESDTVKIAHDMQELVLLALV